MFCLCGQLPVAYFNSINNNSNNKNNSGNNPHIKTLNPKPNTYKVPSCVQFSRVTFSRNSFIVSNKIYSRMWHPVTRYIYIHRSWGKSLKLVTIWCEWENTNKNSTCTDIIPMIFVKNKILLTYLQMFHNPAALG